MIYSFKILVPVILIFQRVVSEDPIQDAQPAVEKQKPDYTYCASDLEKLSDSAQYFISKTDSVLEELENAIKETRWLLSQENSPKEIVDNPLLSYKMISTKVKDSHIIENTFDGLFTLLKKSRDIYKQFSLEIPPPTEHDLIESMESILRLRRTYSLNIENFTKGDLGSLGKIKGSLSFQDLADIGSHCLDVGMYSDAVDFLESAFQLESNQSKRDAIRTKLIQAIADHDEILNKYRIDSKEQDPEEIIFLFNQTLGNLTSDSFKTRQHISKIFGKDEFDLNKEIETRLNFERLCRDDDLKSAVEKRNLKCYLTIPTHQPYWKLCPLKIEVHHESPRIIQIYEILTDQELDKIVQEAKKSLKRSKLYRLSENGTLVSGTDRIRTSSSTWIKDKEAREFYFINEKVERITGYRVSGVLSSEDLQIASYRGGGHYSIHTDGLFDERIRHTFEPSQFRMGDRIATFMIYLSDVALGGNTVFPLLQVGVKPMKNSAILWENLNVDGSINLETLHGGCPVLFGVKQVANKWIRSNDQMFTKKNCRRKL